MKIVKDASGEYKPGDFVPVSDAEMDSVVGKYQEALVASGTQRILTDGSTMAEEVGFIVQVDSRGLCRSGETDAGLKTAVMTIPSDWVVLDEKGNPVFGLHL